MYTDISEKTKREVRLRSQINYIFQRSILFCVCELEVLKVARCSDGSKGK